MKRRWLYSCLCLLVMSVACPASAEAPTPRRVIVFHIDALNHDAPARLGMANVNALLKQGTSVREAYAILPWHPTVGGYGKLHTTNLVNPVTLAGTIFLRQRQKMLQHAFYDQRQLTAHIANTTAYESLNPGFNVVNLNRNDRDADVVNWALRLLREQNIRFMRLVLQDLNNQASQRIAGETANVPWRGNIWAEGSPYIDKAREADRLLGIFVDELRKMDKWDDTLFIVLSDGNASSGWHPIFSQESERLPLVFVGPGIARGRVIPYAENIDIAPTVCHFMRVRCPNQDGGAGRVLTEIAQDASAPDIAPDRQRIKRLNRQIREHLLLQATLRLKAPSDPFFDVVLMRAENALTTPVQFYGLDRIEEWQEAGTLDALLENNDKALDYLRAAEKARR